MLADVFRTSLEPGSGAFLLSSSYPPAPWCKKTNLGASLSHGEARLGGSVFYDRVDLLVIGHRRRLLGMPRGIPADAAGARGTPRRGAVGAAPRRGMPRGLATRDMDVWRP